MDFEIEREERKQAWLDATTIDWQLRHSLPRPSKVVLAISQPWVR